MTSVSFSSLRSLLGKTDGPVYLSDFYKSDVVGGSTSQGTGLNNVKGIQSPPALYQSLTPATRSNVLGMYSTRLLNSNYAGPLLQVKRNSDNATSDFYSDLLGNLKTSAGEKYNVWIGSSVGLVVKWYDQSGANRDATNSSSPVLPPRLLLDPAGSGKYVLFFPNSKIPDPDLKIQLSFNSTFPAYNSTGGTAPTFDYTSQTDNYIKFNPGSVTSASASCQVLNFGSQTFNMATKGFTALCKFRFTGTANAWERIFDFGNGGPNDNIVLNRNGAATQLQLSLYNSASTTYLQSTNNISQNTLYNVGVVYDPAVGTNGTMYIYINGTLNASGAASFKLTDRTLNSCYVGKSLTAVDGAFNGDIFSLKVFDRVLTSTEIAAADEYGNNYSGLTIAAQNVTSVMSTFYPIQTLNTFHTLLATSTDLSMRFWANPNAVGGGPWPVGSANNATYKLLNNDTGDFMNSAGGGYCFFNNAYVATSPYCAFAGGSWNTFSFSRSSGTVSALYIGQHAGAASRAFYGYMSDFITFGSTLPTSALTSGTISSDYKVFDKLSTLVKPWSSGLVGRYSADSWTGTKWLDTSGSGNDVTVVNGTIAKATSSDASGLGGLEYLYGNTSASLTFPSNVISTSNYTLMHLARYNGATNRRIFTAPTLNETDLAIRLTYLNTFPSYNSTGGVAPTWDATTSFNFIKFNPGDVLSNSATSQFLDFGAQTFNVGTQGFSLTITFRFTGTAGFFERLFEAGSGAGNDLIALYRDGTNSSINFLIRNSTTDVVYITSIAVTQNVIYNMAFVYDPTVGANGTLYYYMNGVQQSTGTIVAKPNDRSVTISYVGRSQGTGEKALNGDIFSLRVYNRALNSTEIANADNIAFSNNWLSGFRSGYAGYAYHGNTQVTSAIDRHGTNWVLSTDQYLQYRSLTGNRNSYISGPTNTSWLTQLTLDNTTADARSGLPAPVVTGTAVYTTNRKTGTAALDLTANTAGGTATNCLTYTLSAGNYSLPITMACWFNASSVSATQDIVTMGNNTNTATLSALLNIESNGTLGFGANVGAWTTRVSPFTISTGVWYHIALTVNASSSLLCYFNGVLIASIATGAGTLGVTNGSGTPNQIRVGAITGSGIGTAFKGLVDDVRVYNRVLSAQEIAGLYNSSELSSAPSFPLTLTVNGESSETSDWAVACILAFNRVLSLTEYLALEDSLASRYRIPVPIQDGLVCSLDAYDYVLGSDSTTWRDRTANGYNFKLSSTAAYNTTPPYMNFTGTGASMYGAYRGTPGTTGDDLPIANNMTMVFITQTVSTANSDYRSLTRGGPLTSMHHVMIDVSTPKIGCYNVSFINCDNPLDLTTLAGSTTRFNMWVLVQSTTAPQWQLYYNPTSLPLSPVGTITNANAGPVYGVSYLGANLYNWPTWNIAQRWGNIAAFMYYHRRLTPEEMVDLYNRYTVRHNLPTSTSHYRIFAPYMWLRASDLSSLSHGATISSWISTGPVWGHTSTGYNAGTATLPTLDKTSESQPFVRLGTGTDSTTNGNYFDFGSKTFNLSNSGGFTFVGYVRFRSAASFEKIFDFGSGAPNNNLLMSRNDVTNRIYASYYSGSSGVETKPDVTIAITGGWQTVAMRVTESELATFYGANKHVMQNTVALSNRTFTNTYIGRTQTGWGSFANIDVKELAFYERPLSDSEITQVRTFFESQSQSIPATISSRVTTAKNAIVTSGLKVWIDVSLLQSYDPEMSTTILRDISGNNNNFTLTGTGYTYNNSGYLSFSGASTAYATGPNSSTLGLTYDHTIEVLFQSYAAVNTALFNIHDTSANLRMINLHMPYSDGKYYYDALWPGSTNNRTLFSVILSQSLRYIVCRCRTTSGTTYIEIYENGILKAGPVAITRGGSWNGIMRLFADHNNTTTWNSGSFHFFRFYNRALSDTELAQNLSFVQNKYTLTNINIVDFEYKAENLYGTTLLNSGFTGSSFNATSVGGITTSTDAYGTYLNINRASSQYISLPSITWNCFTNLAGLTMFFVARLTSAGSYERFCDFSPGTGLVTDRILLARSDVSTSAIVEVYQGGTFNTYTSSTNFIDTNWHIYGIAIKQLSASSFNIRLFRDNLSTLYMNQNTTYGLTDRTTPANWIGRPAFSNAYLQANMRDIKIYRTCLSDAEITYQLTILRNAYGL